MIETEAGISVYKYKVKVYVFFEIQSLFEIYVFICTRWKIFSNMSSPKVFNNSYYFHKIINFWERNWKLNKYIYIKVETFVMFLYLRNRKYVSDFVYWLLLFDFSRSGSCSNNNIFLFHSFFPRTWKASKQGILFARNWKCCLKVTNISFCTKRWM